MTLPARLFAGLLALLLVVPSIALALASARADDSAQAAPERSARASGLAWHSGVFSHDAAQTTRFAQARGRPVDVLAVFPSRDSWEAILQDWWMSPSAVPPGFTGTLAVGVPLFPDDGSLAAAAAGTDDARWEELGRLIASRYPDAWMRPGWEMNIPNWPWAATPENVEQYKAAFRRAATALRRGGPGLRIVFNPNEGRGASLPDAHLAYPGDDVVDVIGIDAYDWYPAYDAGGWEEHRTKDQGWDFWADFARSRGKKFAVPEWGVMTGSPESGGDNPTYIRSVLEWMGAHADLMAFDAYFEETQDYCRCALSQNPRAAAEYAQVLPRAAAASAASTASVASVASMGSTGGARATAGATAAPAPLGDAEPDHTAGEPAPGDSGAPEAATEDSTDEPMEELTEEDSPEREPSREGATDEPLTQPSDLPSEQRADAQVEQQAKQQADQRWLGVDPGDRETESTRAPTSAPATYDADGLDTVVGAGEPPSTGAMVQPTRRPGRGLYGREESSRLLPP